MPEQTGAQVRDKAAAFDRMMATQDRASRRTAALQAAARRGGPDGGEARRILASEAATAGQKAEADALASLPKSIEEAGGDATAYMKADMRRRVAAKEGKAPASASRASMELLLRAKGVEPVRR